jgi:ABC-type antimicrobial peptide transport system permease subunit
MIRHTVLLVYRNYKRFKTTFFINLIGLSTGLACALLIYLWVKDELSIDRFHEHGSRLYQVMANQHNQGGIETWEDTPGLLADALMREVPGIQYAVSTSGGKVEKFRLRADDKTVVGKGQFASQDFFNLFSFRLLEGNKVLDDPRSIVISASLARKLFGRTESVLGKTIEWEIFGLKNEVKVTGIFEDVPAHASAPFDFLLSFEFFEKNVVAYPYWSNNYAKTYLLLREHTDETVFNRKIHDFLKTKQKDSNITLFLFHVTDKYLYGQFENGRQSGGRIVYVELFSLIAGFILIIACINFMNLSTAKAAGRIKEVGIKKAIGAGRRVLIFHYLGESLIMTFLSAFVAVLLVDLALPQFNDMSGKNIHLTFDGSLIMSLMSIVLVTGFVAGSYPALYLSSFNPASILKGRLGGVTADLWARKGLVIFQFALAVILISGVIVVYRQIQFVQNKNLGYDRKHIISFPLEGRVTSSRETFISELKRIPGVANAACTDYEIGYGSWTYGISYEGNSDYNIQYHEVQVGYDAIDLLGIEVVAGRTFSPNFPSDSSGIIFNERAIQVMGLKDPVGKTVQHYTGQRTIVGVVKDFYFQSLYTDVKPLFFIFKPQSTSSIMVKLEPGREQEAIQSVGQMYQRYNPGFSFDYQFLDQEYQNLYASERRVALLSRYFATLAILISCLGLFGLAAFTAERRTKEIGIRKVLGATELGLVGMLSIDFTRMVIIAIFIAIPLSYAVSRTWLDRFAFKIELSIWYFAGAGLCALLVAWLTVAAQSIRAAKLNPAKCLRDE